MTRGRRDYARRSRMRDMARRRRDMARRRDPETGRYSRGYTDNARGRDMNYMGDYHYVGDYPMGDYRERNGRYGSMDYARRTRQDYAMGRQPTRQYYGYYGDTPFYTGSLRDFRGDYNYGDYGEEMMSEEELCDWYDELVEELEPNEKEMFNMDMVEKRAGELGIKFKEFSPEALAVVTVMLYDDYKDTLGKGNPDLYLKLAKDWLEDDDAEVSGEEKLTAYRDNIVMPE